MTTKSVIGVDSSRPWAYASSAVSIQARSSGVHVWISWSVVRFSPVVTQSATVAVLFRRSADRHSAIVALCRVPPAYQGSAGVGGSSVHGNVGRTTIVGIMKMVAVGHGVTVGGIVGGLVAGGVAGRLLTGVTRSSRTIAMSMTKIAAAITPTIARRIEITFMRTPFCHHDEEITAKGAPL